jgi:Fic family protein
MPDYHWKPIQELPKELESYTDQDLRFLEEEWQKVRLDTAEEKLNKILNEVKREWAIETGKIEGLYTLTKGITETLIKNGINAKLISHSSTNRDPELVAAMLKDQQDVIEGLFDFVAQRRELSLSYIREMHQTFTRHQETTTAITPDGNLVEIQLIKGDWKKWPNNPLTSKNTIHDYCPPEQVASEMDRLIEMHKQQMDKSISPEVEAAFLHHRFTQIHPFQDGNGRVARSLASLIFLRKGDFPFVVKDEERATYIHALEEADRGLLMPLINLISEKQKDILFKALSEAQNLDVDHTIKIIKERSKHYYEVHDQNKFLYELVNQVIQSWREIAEDLLRKYQDALDHDSEIGFSAPNDFEIITYEGVHTSLDLCEPLHLIESAKHYTIAINFLSEKIADLRLFLGSIGTNNLPETIYASLYSPLEKRISSLQLDSTLGQYILKIKFRDWLINQLNVIFTV